VFDAPAEAYDALVGRYSRSLAEALSDLVALAPGARTLDVGCGPGGLTAVLAARLGAANVAAVDPSASFVAACRARVPGAEVLVAGAEDLPFADGAFDAVLSQLVINFVPDPPAGVREMVRVVRRGGTVAGCVWDYGGAMTLLRTFWDAAREVDPAAGAAADEGPRMRYCGEGELAALWREAGLDEVRAAPLDIEAAYTGFDDLWSGFTGGVGPAGAYCVGLGEGQRAALRAALRRRLMVGDEPFSLPARAWAAAGRVP
jgi:SAM-dependent methyltransferase